MLDGGIVWEPSWQQFVKFLITHNHAQNTNIYISFGEIIKLPGAQFSAPKLERHQFKAARLFLHHNHSFMRWSFNEIGA